MSQRAFALLGGIAIPVGHRVEVLVLTRDVGVFSKDIRPDPAEPLVRDLDTGVYYGRHWQFRMAEPSMRTLTVRLPQPPDDVVVAERVVGRVVTCIVWTDGQTEKFHAATTLVVELEGGGTVSTS